MTGYRRSSPEGFDKTSESDIVTINNARYFFCLEVIGLFFALKNDLYKIHKTLC